MFDYKKLKELQDSLKKQAFVPIDSKSAQAAPPDAGAGGPPPEAAPPPGLPMDPAAGGGMPPMDPAMMGGDPAMAAGGMPPMDPAMMGGDPAMAGMPPPPVSDGSVGPNGESMITMTTDQFLKFLKQMMALAGKNEQPQQVAPAGAPGGDQATLAEVNAKLDAIIHGGC